jgi:phosphatidylinositol 4-kinase
MVHRRTIRGNALEKLARLSAQSPSTNTPNNDFERLYKRCHSTSKGSDVTGGLKITELEAILALCKAAPYVESIEVAAPLLDRLSTYLPSIYAQILLPSPSLHEIEPSPYEVLSYNLTSAILQLGTRHEQLRSKVTHTLGSYVEGWTSTAANLSAEQFDDDDNSDSAADGELSKVITHSLSLLGFLDATAEYAKLWNAYERLQFIEDVKTALSEQFLIAFETALSIARNARSHQHSLREWKRYTKHYAAIGRPLGAMILHDSFLKVVVTSASLLVETPARNPRGSILDHLKTSYNKNVVPRDPSEDALAEGLTRIAINEMNRLENDLDYLQRVGSAWQQRQASSVKAKVITTYLCCTVYDEDIADDDVLLTWLDHVLNDPTQSADHDLASAALKSMAILAKASLSTASTLGRSLPRLIVQANFDHRTSSVAADSLAAVLSLLPQDAIITTLYSLGNVISAGPTTTGATSASPSLNGTGNTLRTPGVYAHQSNGSTISLTPSDVEEPHHVHTTIVDTVVSVASKCKDEKITALALSMLIQKIGRASKVVDVKIITDAALLGIYTPPAEFRSLLKLYSKLCHDALVKDDAATLDAVSAIV